MKASKYKDPLYNLEVAQVFLNNAMNIMGQIGITADNVKDYYIYQETLEVFHSLESVIQDVRVAMVSRGAAEDIKKKKRAKKPKKKVKKAK